MLSADKNVTLTEFHIKTLTIREKELNYFVGLYNSISGMSYWLLQLVRYRSYACWLRFLISEDELSAKHSYHC